MRREVSESETDKAASTDHLVNEDTSSNSRKKVRRKSSNGVRRQVEEELEAPSGSGVARPFRKFVGGKTQLLHRILPIIPGRIATYHEPFVGGGAVFWALANERRFDRAIIGDNNKELIDTYCVIRDDVDGLVDLLEAFAKADYREIYYSVRDDVDLVAYRAPGRSLNVRRAGRMIWLGRTCFNGLLRYNKRGLFNVPIGDYINPTICDEPTLRACSEVLRRGGVEVRCESFESVLDQAAPGDFVYADSPYVPLSVTSSFTAYTSDGFGMREQMRLRDVAWSLREAGVHVLLSNSSAPAVYELYKSFDITEVAANRSVNSKASGRGKIKELLIQ